LGAFDHPSAAYGAGVTAEGKMLLSCGTSWVGFTPVRGRKKVLAANLLCDPFLEEDDLWGGYFSLPKVGRTVDLYIEKFISNNADRYDVFNESAARAEPGADGLTIDVREDPPENLSADKKNIARALMEGVARLLNEKIKSLAGFGIFINEITMAGGPSESPLWPGIVEAVIEMPVVPLKNGAHAGAIGAALIAAKKSGA